VEPIPIQVLIGNGKVVVVEGLVKELKIKIQDHTLNVLVYLLLVLGVDLVLGLLG